MKKWFLIFGLLLCVIPAHATITPISGCAVAAATCGPLTVQVGDLLVANAFRSATTAPSLAAGWTSIANASASSSSQRVACAVATTTSFTVGTFTNATSLSILIYRGSNGGTTANCNTTGIGTIAAGTGTTSTINCPTIAMSKTDGSSWVACVGGASTTFCTPSTMTAQETVTGSVNIFNDTNGGVSSWPSTNCTGSGNWKTEVLEILAYVPPPCTNTAYGVFTCVQAAHVSSGGTTAALAFGSNVTSGNWVGIFIGDGSASTTFSFSGCSPVTFAMPGANLVSGLSANHAWGIAGSTGACTVTVTSTGSGSMEVVGVEISGTNGTVDKNGLATATGSSPYTGPSVSTTVNGDFILSEFEDDSFAGTVYSGNSGTLILTNASFGIGLQGQVQSTHGAIAPVITASMTHTQLFGTVAIEPNTGPNTGCKNGLFLMGSGC